MVSGAGVGVRSGLGVEKEELVDDGNPNGDFEGPPFWGSSDGRARELRGVDLLTVRRRTSPEDPGVVRTRLAGLTVSGISFGFDARSSSEVTWCLPCLLSIRRSRSSLAVESRS